MSNRFWATQRSFSNDRVTTRAKGTIPGILEAKDIFIRVDEDVMRIRTGQRADDFCELVNSWIRGEDKMGQKFGHREFINHPFHRTDISLNIIHNPSKPYQRAYD